MFNSENLKKKIKNRNSHLKEGKKLFYEREQKIRITRNEIKKVWQDLKIKGYTFQKLREKIGSSFENVYYNDSTMDKEVFKKLQKLLGKRICHKMEVGKIIYNLEINTKLAEMIGIILGDGSLYEPTLTNSHYTLKIALNKIDEDEYVKYVIALIRKLFGVKPKLDTYKKGKGITLYINSKSLVEQLKLIGLKTGNKVKNQVSIPDLINKNLIWIKNHQKEWKIKYSPLVISCLKGLFDTDGSVYVRKSHKRIELSFTNASLNLIKDFKTMCFTLGISSNPKIVKMKKISQKTGKLLIKYRVIISQKKSVKKFLDVINPEKWKDRFRREYIGTQLIYLNNSKEMVEKIENRIKNDFPRRKKLLYTKKNAKYLKNLCTEYKCEINFATIEDAINKALILKKYVYNEKDAKYFTYLYQKLGSFKYIKDFLMDQKVTPLPDEETISAHIKQYLNHKGIDVDCWLKQTKIKKIFINKNNTIIRFPQNLRETICNLIFEFIYDKFPNIYQYQIFQWLKWKIEELDILLINWLLNKPRYNKALKNYFNALIRLIIEIIKFSYTKKKINVKLLSKTKKLELFLSYDVIKKIIICLKNTYPNKFY